MDWWIIILPLVGVVIGAVMQYWLGRRGERYRQLDELRAVAYADYLRAVANAAHQRGPADLGDALRDAADAKARIAVYGSSEVIRALSRFDSLGASLGNDEAVDAFLSAVVAMRGEAESVSAKDLRNLLVGGA